MAVGSRTSLNWAGMAIVNALTIMLAFCLWALVTQEVPAANKEALLILIGVLARDFGTVVGFYFGGSLTNRTQSETIDKQADAIKTAQETPSVAKPDPTVRLEPGETATVQAEK